MSRNGLKRTSRSVWWIWSVIILALAFSGAGYYTYTQLQASRSNEQPVLTTSVIGTGDIVLTATGPGTLIPSENVSFGFKNSGKVSDVLVKLGDRVQEGQVLARLDSKTLELQYQQAAANVAALSSPGSIASAAQAVQEAKQKLASAKDDLQNMIGPDVMIAEDQVASAQQDLHVAQAVQTKDPSAANQQKISEAQSNLKKAQDALTYAYDNSSNAYTLETFTYPIRNTKGTTVRRELIAPTDAELLGARAAYELAQANLYDAQNYLDILNGVQKVDAVPASSVTSITDAKLALDSAKAALDAAELTAPISGTITSLSLNVGDSAGTSAVITIANMNQPYLIDTSLDETDWDKARVGYAATVTFDLLPKNNYSGKIVQVYPKLDDSSGTNMVHILVQLDKPINIDLPSGSTANVDVTGGKAIGAVLVPTSALKNTTSGRYIVYLMKNGKPVEQEVQIGLQDILYAEVKSGLKRGDVVLTDATAVNP
ncbi:MAG TPA: efflux RND transporter periplasmic adaptor subunit [Anaerolineales bacterium]